MSSTGSAALSSRPRRSSSTEVRSALRSGPSSTTLKTILASALAEKPWSETLQLIARETGARFSAIWPLPLPKFDAPFATSSPEMQRLTGVLVETGWHLNCPRNQVVQGVASTSWRRGPVCDLDVEEVDSEGLRNFRDAFLLPHGLGDFAACRIDGGGPQALLTLDRSAASPAFAATDLKAVDAIRCQLEIGIAVARHVNAWWPDQTQGADGLVDSAIVVDRRSGDVLAMSESVEGLLGDVGLRIRDGRSRSWSAGVHNALDVVLQRDWCHNEVVAMPRLGRSPLIVRHVAVSSRHSETQPMPSVGLFVFKELDRPTVDPRVATMLEQLGLSPAEARVAVVVGSGRTPLEASERLSLSESTVRSYLRETYSKLGLDRGSKLQQLVTGLATIVSGKGA